MTRSRKPVSQEELKLGREIQEEYDHGATWPNIAVIFDVSEWKAKRLAKAYRDDCYRRAHQNQLPLFG
ncbi:hypothetical protein [Nocardia sp. BMG51109]|uniref:hypothetical protein n=1 Tax=Nocardia sp. BMG51109 TaxID=1056816 RepID=UPI000463CD80|nr:hypothetical protein [Nocardia sp. BMG51109]